MDRVMALTKTAQHNCSVKLISRRERLGKGKKSKVISNNIKNSQLIMRGAYVDFLACQ